MTENEILIILNGEDKTKEISFIEEENNKVKIIFNQYDKEYSYDIDKVIIKKNSECIDLNGKDLYYNEQLIFNVKKALRFDEFIKVIYENDTSDVFNYDSISLKDVTPNIVRDIITYFKEIAKYVDSGKSEAEKQELKGTFLENEYAKLNYINPQSVLNFYINKQKLKENTSYPKNTIYPFGFNLSQKVAVENIYKSNVSIINGPPGTGKTQTILNIIANLAIMQNKSVAVVSNNNEAVKNVKDKLTKYGYGFICANLGKKENREMFFTNLPEQNVEKFNTPIEKDKLFLELHNLNEKLDELLKLNNRKALLNKEIANYMVEQEYFDYYFKEQNINKLTKLVNIPASSDKILDMLLSIQLAYENKNKFILLYKIQLFIKYGVKNFMRLQRNLMENILSLQKEFYILKIVELESEINDIDRVLDNNNFELLQQRHKEISTLLFQNKLYTRYNNKKKINLGISNYKKNMKLFLEFYPIILSTTYSLRNSVPSNFMFDYVIIDESSQVDLLAGALALSCAKNVIIVGDEKQLSQIVDHNIKKTLSNTYADSCHDYFENNIMSAFHKAYGEEVPSKTLCEHYRCHPKIIEFNNRRYYNNELIAFPSEEHLRVKKPLVLYYTSEGNHMRKITRGKKGTYNQRELDSIKEEVLKDTRVLQYKKEDIGITTPYRLQANKISKNIDKEIESDTIHKYQGREKKLMIMSTVLDNSYQGRKGIAFVDEAHMVNVAVSRAIEQFVIVTDHKLFNEKGTEIKALIKYIKYNALDSKIIQSELVSVFDLLYKEYSKKLISLEKRLLNNSKFKSENIIETILKEELAKEKYKEYDLIREGFLRNFIKSIDILDEKERNYINNGARMDFVIYDKMDKQVALFIEVNGFEYHANNPVQIKKDELKVSICKKCNLKLKVLETDSLYPEEIIRAILNEELLQSKLQ